MSNLPDASSRSGSWVGYSLVLVCAFIFNEIADYVSGFFYSFTSYIYGASTLFGYFLTGIPFGLVLLYLFNEKVKLIIYLLPIFMLVASLLKSIYYFIAQERVFHISDWLAYQVTSGFGLRYFYIAFGAYLFQVVIKKYDLRKLVLGEHA